MQFGEIIFAQTENDAVILARKFQIGESARVPGLLAIHFFEHVFGQAVFHAIGEIAQKSLTNGLARLIAPERENFFELIEDQDRRDALARKDCAVRKLCGADIPRAIRRRAASATDHSAPPRSN